MVNSSLEKIFQQTSESLSLSFVITKDVKLKGRFLQNFVVFSENLNFVSQNQYYHAATS